VYLGGIGSRHGGASRAKLTKDPVFGSLADRRFGDVLAWCQSTVT
jgi:hypothetical protein